MQTLIEKHKHALGLYAKIGTLLGWLIIVYMAGMRLYQGITIFVYPALTKHGLMETIYFVRGSLVSLFPGIFCLLIASLLRYMLGTKAEPGRFLRHADKVLYAYAFFRLVHASYIFSSPSHHNVGMGVKLMMLLPFEVMSIAIMIGAGIIIHMALPIMRESKTLV